MIRLSQIQTKHCLATTNNLVPGFADRMWRFSFFFLFFFFEFVSVFRNYTAFVTKYFRASVRAGDVGFCFLSRFQTTNGWKGQKCQVWGFKVHVLKSQLVAVCSCATYVELFYNGNGGNQQLWGEFTWWTVLNWHSNSSSHWLIALLERCPLQATDQMKPSVQILDCRGEKKRRKQQPHS